MVYKRQKRVYRGRRRKVQNYSKAKKMVTGHGPTLLDRIASGVGSVAKLATAVAPAIAAINTEHKYYDISYSVNANTPGTNDQIVDLTQGITQGTTDVTRIGNSILAQDIYVKGYVGFTASTTTHSSFSRMTIFCWKENIQLNAPTAAKLFETPADIFSPINKDYSDQFVVIKDKLIPHNAQISAATVQGVVPIKFYKKLNWHIRYNATGTTAGTQNHIFICFRGAAAVANTSVFSIHSRLNFTDN